MSSDSEDDCYGNIAQRLQTAKSTFKEDKIESTNLLIELKEKEFTDYSWKKNDVASLDSECGTSQNSETVDEISLDAIIANNSKKPANRAAKRAAEIDTANILPEKKTRAKRGKKNAAKDTPSTSQAPPAEPQAPQAPKVPQAHQASKLPQAPQASEEPQVPEESHEQELSDLPAVVPPTTTQPSSPIIPSIFGHIVNNRTLNTNQANTTTRGRGRARGRGRQTTPRRGRRGSGVCSPARNRRRGRRSIWAMAQEDWDLPQDEWSNPLFNLAMALAASTAMMNGHNQPTNGHSSNSDNNGPIYSVGNTDEYPDQSDNQPLFSSAPNPKPQNDVVVIENDQDLEDNEELSIKVYWQSSEVVKFNLRPFQQLTSIFDHFAEREKVPNDNLLFTYNDKILKSGDTPHSIKYSIVKFIDGGVINQSVSSLIQDSIEDGIKLKFQCMNVKKPFLASIQADEKMQVVMMKCAEHLEKPLDKLKFYFDGDLISGTDTPTGLDLEGGECIDVNIIS